MKNVSRHLYKHTGKKTFLGKEFIPRFAKYLIIFPDYGNKVINPKRACARVQFVCLSISDFEDECGLGDDISQLTVALFKNKIKGPYTYYNFVKALECHLVDHYHCSFFVVVFK